MHVLKIAICLTSLLALVSCGSGGQSPCGPTEGEIIGVTDGDTLTIEADGETYHVRLLLVDTPETKGVNPPDCYGPEASAFTASFRHHEVKLSYEPGDECMDVHDRLLAYVTPVGQKTSINEQLVAGGYARVCRINCDESRYEEFADLELEAQGADIGVWNADNCPDAYTSSWGASGCNRSCQ